MNPENNNSFAYTYRIADVVIRLEAPFPLTDSVNASTFYSPDEQADFSLSFREIPSFTDLIDDYEVLAEGIGENILLSHGEEYRNFTFDGGSYAMTTLGYSSGICYYEYASVLSDMMASIQKPLSFACLEKILLGYDRLILHSSHIQYQGDSIVISAPSGTGKSTHAALWEKYYGATVVNGDRSILGRQRIQTPPGQSEFSGPYRAYGLPMCGSSNIYKNLSSPLKAIVVIRQSPVNQVRRLGPMEAFRCLLSESTQNIWNDAFMERLMNLVESLIREVPVYLLHCNMDRSAADCLHDVLYPEQSEESEKE